MTIPLPDAEQALELQRKFATSTTTKSEIEQTVLVREVFLVIVSFGNPHYLIPWNLGW